MDSLEPRFTPVNKCTVCPADMSRTAEKLIKFRLSDDSRNEGIYICCDKCSKWRYASSHKDPAEFVDRTFFCKDVQKLCKKPEEEHSSQCFYETKFCAGSLVRAKRPEGPNEKDWLWWPAIVEDSLDAASQYFLLDAETDDVVAYHVTFLDGYRMEAWIRADLIRPFESSKNELEELRADLSSEKRRLMLEAESRAKHASSFGVTDRLEKYSYIAHLARHLGVLSKLSQPTDMILNTLKTATSELKNKRRKKRNSANIIGKRRSARNKKSPLASKETDNAALDSIGKLPRKVLDPSTKMSIADSDRSCKSNTDKKHAPVLSEATSANADSQESDLFSPDDNYDLMTVNSKIEDAPTAGTGTGSFVDSAVGSSEGLFSTTPSFNQDTVVSIDSPQISDSPLPVMDQSRVSKQGTSIGKKTSAAIPFVAKVNAKNKMEKQKVRKRLSSERSPKGLVDSLGEPKPKNSENKENEGRASSFTQPIRRKVGDVVTSPTVPKARVSSSAFMTQPTLSQNRGKFTPPTKLKSIASDESLRDFEKYLMED